MKNKTTIPLPTLTKWPAVTTFNTIVALVRNRTGINHTEAFNKVLRNHSDLMHETKLPHGVDSFGRLLNRCHDASCHNYADEVESVAKKVAALTNRFAPAFNMSPTAMQWDVLWRTALQLEEEGIPERLLNKRVGDPEVDPADLKIANERVSFVMSKLNSENNDPIDRGTMEPFLHPNTSPGRIQCAFRTGIRGAMKRDGLTLSQAFDKLKEDEPIFWTLAMLSFEPEK